MDKLVDGYRVDIYPSRDLHRFASTRTDDLEQVLLPSACR
jgi:hypothetical protein